jgi:adenine-specific DNA-methyltransferase
MDKIVKANDEQLSELFNEIKDNAYLNYKVDFMNLINNFEEFKKLNESDKKLVLMDMLDKNLLYLNYTSMADETYDVTEDEKTFSDSFYEKGRDF